MSTHAGWDAPAGSDAPAGDEALAGTADEGALFALLNRLGIETSTVRHDAVFTVAEAKAHRGALPGAHTKNLFVKDKRDACWLVVALEDRAIDLTALGKRLGAAKRLSFGSPERLRASLGVEPGSVTPFAAINDRARRVRIVLDEGMMAAGVLNFHPLVNTATTAIAPADLLRFLAATGHEPLVIALPLRAQA
jgi:Ala-tRNA(Pro) deacylase